MIWGRTNKLEEKQLHLTNWHRWFAWRPVKLNDERWCWLESIERRIKEYGSIYITACSEYRVKPQFGEVDGKIVEDVLHV